MRELLIGKNEANQRLDKLLTKYLPGAGKNFLYKMMRVKNITLNNKKCTGREILSEGDCLKLWLSEDTIVKFSRPDIHIQAKSNLDPIFEDEDIVVFNKPAGLLSQKSSNNDESVNDILLKYLLDSGQISKDDLSTFKPSICNRLDRNTSGLIICGKSLKGLQEMAEYLKTRAVHKDYIAVVKGEIRTGKSICGYLTKDNKRNIVSIGESGEYIETEYKPLWTDGRKSYLIVRLITGKPHQIRAHLAAIGHPILGDGKYGDGKGASRQLLHAYRLTLPNGTIIEAQPPEDMKWELGNPGAFEDLPLKI